MRSCRGAAVSDIYSRVIYLSGLNLIEKKINNPALLPDDFIPLKMSQRIRAKALTGIPQIDAASREETSGKFLSFDETPLMW